MRCTSLPSVLPGAFDLLRDEEKRSMYDESRLAFRCTPPRITSPAGILKDADTHTHTTLNIRMSRGQDCGRGNLLVLPEGIATNTASSLGLRHDMELLEHHEEPENNDPVPATQDSGLAGFTAKMRPRRLHMRARSSPEVNLACRTAGQLPQRLGRPCLNEGSCIYALSKKDYPRYLLLGTAHLRGCR